MKLENILFLALLIFITGCEPSDRTHKPSDKILEIKVAHKLSGTDLFLGMSLKEVKKLHPSLKEIKLEYSRDSDTYFKCQEIINLNQSQKSIQIDFFFNKEILTGIYYYIPFDSLTHEVLFDGLKKNYGKNKVLRPLKSGSGVVFTDTLDYYHIYIFKSVEFVYEGAERYDVTTISFGYVYKSDFEKVGIKKELPDWLIELRD